MLFIPIMGNAQTSEICGCADALLSMAKEAKDAKMEMEKMKAIQEKYKARMEKCDKLGKGKTDDELKKMREEMEKCASYKELEEIQKELMGESSEMEELEIYEDIDSNTQKFDEKYWNKISECKVYLIEGKEKAESGDHFGAIADYNKAMNIYPKHYYVCYERGMAKFNLTDYRGAIEDFNKALEADLVKINPKYYEPSVYFQRGIAKAKLKNYQGAVEDYNKVIELNPKDEVAYYNRGLFKLDLYDIEGACLDFSKAGELGMAEAYELIRKHCN